MKKKHKPETKIKTDHSVMTTTNLIKSILVNSSEIKDQVLVIKLPSLIIERDDLLSTFTANVQLISSCGAKVFIVHDHTQLVQSTLNLFGLDQKFINNVAVVDHRSSQILEMVLSGYVNKLIVSKLCNLGCIAVGISGKDGNLLRAKKSKLLHKVESATIIDVGFISEPVVLNPEIIMTFESNNIIPVISPIASDINGNTHLLDVNLLAALISEALDADHLVFLDEYNIFNDTYCRINESQSLRKAEELHSKNPQICSIIKAATSSISASGNLVHFINAQTPDSMLLSIFT